MALTTVKIVVLAPIPKASDRTAMAVNALLFASMRNA